MINNKIMTKQDGLVIKGIAILLMIAHHLFAFPKRISKVSYISLVHINDISIEYYIGIFGVICVPIFIFISGYGLFVSYKNNIYKRIFKFYKNFFVVFIIFVSIGSSIGLLNTDLKSVVMNLLTLSSSLNGEWWFVQLYILLLILYPIIHKIVLRYNYIVILGISIFIYLFIYLFSCFSMYLFKFEINIHNIIFSNIMWIFIGMIKLVSIYQIYLVIGCIVAKKKLFEKINIWMIKNKINNYTTYIILLIFTIIISFTSFIIKYIIATPIFIFSCINIFKNNKILMILGKHSNNIWLVHTFFCYYYFQNIIFYPKYSILIMIWLTIISLIVSIGINLILYKIDKILINLRNKLNI